MVHVIYVYDKQKQTYQKVVTSKTTSGISSLDKNNYTFPGILDSELIASYIIKFLFNNYPNILKEKYGIDNIDDLVNTFDLIAKKRGALLKGGLTDYDKVYSIIINDLKNGSIKNVTFDIYK